MVKSLLVHTHTYTRINQLKSDIYTIYFYLDFSPFVAVVDVVVSLAKHA